jgi:hypothetical protein
MPIIKPAQKKRKTNTTTAQIHKQIKEYNIILQEKVYKVLEKNPTL